MGFFIGALLAKLLSPIVFFSVLLTFLISKKKWIIPLSAVVGTIAGESFLTMMSNGYVWGQIIIPTFIASFIHSLIIYKIFVIGFNRDKSASPEKVQEVQKMNVDKFITEIKKIPMPPKLAKEFQNPTAFDEMIEHLKTLSSTQINVTFNFMRLSFYREFISELGYLPSKLILDAVGASSVSIRTMKELDDSSHQNIYSLLSDIRQLGEGIALASKLESSNRDDIQIKVYTEHPFVSSLDSNATAGDCFLFNVMFYATSKVPFKDIPISPVVTHYFERFKTMEEAEDNLSIALDTTVTDIFGKQNPLLARVSEPPKNV